jgi:hypothetical protein
LKRALRETFRESLKTKMKNWNLKPWYNITLSPFSHWKSKFTTVFVVNRNVVTTGIFSTYFYLILALLVLLALVILILFKSIKNSQITNEILSKNADEISTMFRRQACCCMKPRASFISRIKMEK